MIAHNLLLFALFTWHYLSGRWSETKAERQARREP